MTSTTCETLSAKNSISSQCAINNDQMCHFYPEISVKRHPTKVCKDFAYLRGGDETGVWSIFNLDSDD